MRYSFKSTLVAAAAALGLASTVVATPAQAQWHGGGGFHGGGFHGGGFHGGGWGGGGFRGGWGRPGWGRPGWGGPGWRRAGWGGAGWGGPGWGGGCWNCGWGWDPGWAVAAATVPLIAAAAAAPVYVNDAHCWTRRRVWDSAGRYLGVQTVNLCM